MKPSDFIPGDLRGHPSAVMDWIVIASTFRRLLVLFGLAASCRRLVGVVGTGFVGLIWHWHRFEIHVRWRWLPGWRRLLGAFVVFGIAHYRNPFVSRPQPAALRKVPLNEGIA